MNILLVEFYMMVVSLISILVISQKNINNTILNGIMFLSAIITSWLLFENRVINELSIYIWNFNLKVDMLTLSIKLLIIFFLLNYIYLSKNYFNYENLYIKEFLIVIWILFLGSFFLLMSNEFFILFLSLELQNLILYFLTNLRRNRSLTIEASLKYFLLGSFSSAILLYGIIMLFGILGTLDFVEISYLLKDLYFVEMEINVILFFFFFIIIGFLFKLGVAPFHWWVPEVYVGAPVLITLLFSYLPKLTLIFIFFKLYIYIFFFFNYILNLFFFFFVFFSLIVGFLFSFYQKTIIKFLAYSSIFNGGFFLAAFSNGTFFSFLSLFYFFLPYLFILLGIFFFLIAIRKLNNEKFKLLWDLSILGNTNKYLGIILSVFFFSLAGIPPLAGFFGKFFLLMSLILNKFFILFFIVMFFSVISSFYYFRVVRFIFFSNIMEYTFLKYNLNIYFLIFYLFLNVYFFFFFDSIFFFFFYLFNLNFFI